MKKDSVLNPFADRLAAFVTRLRRRRLTAAIVQGAYNQRGLIGFGCDNGRLLVPSDGTAPVFYTDFRYIPEAKRKSPWVKVRNLTRFERKPPVSCGRGGAKSAMKGRSPRRNSSN